MKIREVKVKSLLSKSSIADLCINPYIGCEHACVYCYAAYYARKYRNRTERWGSYVDVKINAKSVLLREIRKNGIIYLSSLTDPYQPLEKRYKLTRKILQILLRHNRTVIIQTKSSLVLRDLDLLKKFKNATVGLTIITLNENVRKIFEPNASSVKERVNTLKVLKENEIDNFVFVGPILPHLTHTREIVRSTKKFTDKFFFDKLNLKPGLWNNIELVLEKNYPNLLEMWKEILFGDRDYYGETKRELRRFLEKEDVSYEFVY